MFKTASITDLRNNLAETIDTLEKERALLIVRHSKPAAYLVAHEFFERLIDQIEDLLDIRDMEVAISDYRQGKAMAAEEVFERLSL